MGRAAFYINCLLFIAALTVDSIFAIFAKRLEEISISECDRAQFRVDPLAWKEIETRTARRHLNRFEELGLVRKAGSGPSIEYEVI